MSYEFLCRLPKPIQNQLKSEYVEVTSATGYNLKVIGSLEEEIYIDGIPYKEKFLVNQSTEMSIILGNSFMLRCSLMIDPQNDKFIPKRNTSNSMLKSPQQKQE